MAETLDKRWILFDVGGVLELVDEENWLAQLMTSWASRIGMPVPEFRQRLDRAELPRIDITSGTHDEHWRRIGLALSIDPSVLRRFQEEFWDAYCGRENVELIDYARELRARAGVAILSNSVDGAREEEERRFGFSGIFDPICYSHEQGVGKPDPLAYELAVERMRTTPDRVLFIDDRLEAVEGAARCGIAGTVHRNNAETIRAIERFLAGDAVGLAAPERAPAH